MGGIWVWDLEEQESVTISQGKSMENLEYNSEDREAKDEMDSRDIYKEEWISLISVREEQIRFTLKILAWTGG